MTAIVLRIALLVFLVPALHAKLSAPARLARAIAGWRIVRAEWCGFAATALISAEGILAFCFGFGLYGGIAGWFGAIFFLALAIASSSVIVRGIHTSCSCFSLEGNEAVGPQTVLRTLLLSAASVGVAVSSADPYLTSIPGLAPALLLLAPLVGWVVGRNRVRRHARGFASVERAAA